ncbi:U1 small nuclear ribonucleoprotein 70 kDa, partial [Desmophyllum pertusum]
DFNTTEETLFEMFDRYGSIEKLRLVEGCENRKVKRLCFCQDESEANRALRETKDERLEVDGRKVLVDRVRAGVTPSWLPRRLGGGLGQRQKGTQRFAWKLAYFGDTSRIDHAEIYRKQELWLEHK